MMLPKSREVLEDIVVRGKDSEAVSRKGRGRLGCSGKEWNQKMRLGMYDRNWKMMMARDQRIGS